MVSTETLLSYFYIVYFLLATLFQLLLLYCIVFHSPKYMRMFTFLLGSSAISQLLTLYTACFVQLGIVTDKDPLIMESFGPCRFYDSRTCFVIYLIGQTFALISPISILIMFYFKFLSVSTLIIPTHRFIRCIILFHAPIVVFAILQFWTPQIVYKAPYDDIFYKVLNIDVSTRMTVAYLSLNSFLVTFTLSVINLVAFVPVPLCWYLRRRILQEVNRRIDKLSLTAQTQHKTFVLGLFIQVLIPTIIYPVAFTVYYAFAIIGIDLPLQKFSGFLVGAFPFVVDPVVSLYFVTPYRRRIYSWVNKSEIGTLPVVTRFSS